MSFNFTPEEEPEDLGGAFIIGGEYSMELNFDSVDMDLLEILFGSLLRPLHTIRIGDHLVQGYVSSTPDPEFFIIEDAVFLCGPHDFAGNHIDAITAQSGDSD